MESKTKSSCRSSNNIAPSSTSRASDRIQEVQNLKCRKDVALTEPRYLNDVWQELVDEIVGRPTDVNVSSTSRNWLTAADLVDFEHVLTTYHESEDAFDQGLFLALRKCLSRHGLIPQEPKSESAQRGRNVFSYVSGLTPRKKKRELKQDSMATPTRKDPYEGSGKTSGVVPNALNFENIGERGATSLEIAATPSLQSGPPQAAASQKELGTYSEKAQAKTGVNAIFKGIGSNVVNVFSPGKARQLKEAKLSLEPIVLSLQPGEDTAYPIYAIGVARQANGDGGSRGKSESTGSGLAANSKLDHCSCLLEKETRDSRWTVVRCFSVVELKYGTDNECVAATIVNNKAQALHLESAGGVLAQALTYTMGWVLPSHASLGDRTSKLIEIPWAAIIGKKKPDSKKTGGQQGKSGKKEADDTDAWNDKLQDVGKTRRPGIISKFRWMSGKIYVPEYCGDHFTYSATGCGNLDNCEVVSVYLETLLFGLRAAKILLEAIRANIKISPLPSSGRKVRLGHVELEGMKLQGKCHVGKRLRSDPDDDGKWTVSQGEIFTGKVNFSHLIDKQFGFDDDDDTVAADDDETITDDDDHDDEDDLVEAKLEDDYEEHDLVEAKIEDSSEEDDLVEAKVDDGSEEDDLAEAKVEVVSDEEIVATVIDSQPTLALLAAMERSTRAPSPIVEEASVLIFKEDTAVVDVVVKVAALSVHKFLNHPDKAWSALLKIHSAFLEGHSGTQSHLNEEHFNLHTQRDLFNVLLAAERTPTGLTTIMADLSNDYKTLTPNNERLSFKVVWSAFLDLVMRILVPLACKGVIHPDIRPGWDVTSNILYSGCRQPAMQIIDFDSLINHQQWEKLGVNHRYIEHGTDKSCFKFLWLQCVTTAYAWHAQVNQIDMEKVNMQAILQDRTNKFSASLGKEFCSRAAKRKISYKVLVDDLLHMHKRLTR